jgi:hypothetical protein
MQSVDGKDESTPTRGRTPSFSRAGSWSTPAGRQMPHHRTVSYDDLHHMGLSRAVDEYHKLLRSKSYCGKYCKGPEHCLLMLCKLLCLQPVPIFLRPEFCIKLLGALWAVVAWALHVTVVFVLPLVMSFTLLPGTVLNASGSPLSLTIYDRFLIFIAYVLLLMAAEARMRCLRARRDEQRFQKESSLSGYSEMRWAALYDSDGTLMTSKNMTDTSKLLQASGSGEIEAKNKEDELMSRVQQLVLKYGMFKSTDECHVSSVSMAYRWITTLAAELEESRYMRYEEMNLDSALEAADVLGAAIGI